MTLLEIKNQVLIFFSKNNTFFAQDFNKILLDPNQEDIREGLITQVLNDLVEEGYCREILDASGNVVAHSLIMPQYMQFQQVEISNSTAALIGEIFEQYSKGTKQSMHIDILNLKEEDIQNLCLIIAQLIQSQS